LSEAKLVTVGEGGLSMQCRRFSVQMSWIHLDLSDADASSPDRTACI
jgi:hypothetical protein